MDAPSTGPLDLVRLLAQLGAGRLRTDFDAQAAGCRWARALLDQEKASDLRIGAFGRGVELIGSRARSDRILAASPADGAPLPGNLKTEGMSFLAPAALTITHGEQWRRLRDFNEDVLGTGGTHAFAQSFHAHVRGAFAEPVRDRTDVRRALARAMVGIVFGEAHGEDVAAAEDARVLLDVVQSPLKRKLLGFHYRRRRDRLYAFIERRWQRADAEDGALLSLARRLAPDGPTPELLQQVPHWMFTFTASGTDLLVRTLALIAARPGVRRRVVEEVAAAGPPDDAASVERLDFVQACLLEAGRLFPPATRTFHRASADGGKTRDAVHYFPLLQRDDALGPTVHHFLPERWRQDVLDAPASASNLFLRGPRACPGRDLILFVCRSAIARLIGELQLTAPESVLSRDPLPVSFPERSARFTTAQVTR